MAIGKKAPNKWKRARTREEVVAALRAARVHVEPVNDMRDVFGDEQLVHRRACRLLEHPEIGRHSVPGPSFVLPAVARRPTVPGCRAAPVARPGPARGKEVTTCAFDRLPSR